MQTESKRWIYLIVGTVINVIIGQTYAWSVFVNPLAKHFTWSAADVSIAFAIFHSISCIPIIIAGKVQDYVQPKFIILFGSIIYGIGMLGVGYVTTLNQLYIAYGVMGGISMGTIYSGIVPNMVRFFPDRRGLVSGILAAGVGSGALIWAPVAAMMIEKYQVLPTFKMLGALYLVLLCGLSLLIQTAPVGYTPAGWKPSANQQKVMNIPDKDWRGMLGDPLFYCLAGVVVMGGIAGLMIVAHASPILQAVGQYSAVAAGSWVGVLALCNSGGRVGWGFISDRIGRMPSLIIIYSILGVAMFWLASSPYMVVVPVLIVGMCFGGFMGMLASLTADAFGPKFLAVNFGVMFLPFGLAAFTGPRLAAVIKAGSGSYSQAFLIASVLSFIGIGLAIVASMLLQRKRQGAMMIMAQSTTP
ncbi:MAG: Major facilitator superfamily MFS_1 [uncultured bacterium]|nr:MAG: Major facilitator superfamily MFS_1 [uncultured bacterium]